MRQWDDARIACQPPARLHPERRAVGELASPGCNRAARKHAGIDVDDDLVTVAPVREARPWTSIVSAMSSSASASSSPPDCACESAATASAGISAGTPLIAG